MNYFLLSGLILHSFFVSAAPPLPFVDQVRTVDNLNVNTSILNPEKLNSTFTTNGEQSTTENTLNDENTSTEFEDISTFTTTGEPSTTENTLNDENTSTEFEDISTFTTTGEPSTTENTLILETNASTLKPDQVNYNQLDENSSTEFENISTVTTTGEPSTTENTLNDENTSTEFEEISTKEDYPRITSTAAQELQSSYQNITTDEAKQINTTITETNVTANNTFETTRSTTEQIQTEMDTTFFSDNNTSIFEEVFDETTTESISDYTNELADPLQCPIYYTGSQCNFQAHWCTDSVCFGDNNGKGNCYSYTSYECHCKKNDSCLIENATPSWLNGLTCFDINTAHHGNGEYYNFFAEFQNYNDEPIQSYSCGCQKNYGKKGIRHCSVSTCMMNSTNPCKSHDSCRAKKPLSNSLDIVYCSCESGENCFKSNKTDYCNTHQPCPVNSTCLTLFTDSFFTSNFNPFNLTLSYTCACPSKNQSNCFKPNDPCGQKENQCMNSGTCVVYEEGSELKSKCMCPEGTTGKNCESFLKCLEPLKNYNREACYFNGKCIYSLEDYFLGNDYTCECVEGFNGKYCDECASETCLNGGQCAFNSAYKLECLCPYGYKGARCEIRYDFCEFKNSFMCSNETNECTAYKDYYCNCNKTAGTCKKQVCNFQTGCHDTGDSCLAPPDFHSYGCNCYMFSQTLGEDLLNGRCNLGNMNNCEEKIYTTSQSINWFYETVKSDNFCSNKNSCSFGFDSYMSYFMYFCECEDNISCLNGLSNPCANNLCKPGVSTCLASNLVDSYFCKSNKNATGNYLMSTHPCAESPCKNGGTCLAQVNLKAEGQQKAKCLCPKGAFGEHCENLINYCQINYCGINGNCTNTLPGKFKCECQPDFTGKFCDKQIQLSLAP